MKCIISKGHIHPFEEEPVGFFWFVCDFYKRANAKYLFSGYFGLVTFCFTTQARAPDPTVFNELSTNGGSFGCGSTTLRSSLGFDGPHDEQLHKHHTRYHSYVNAVLRAQCSLTILASVILPIVVWDPMQRRPLLPPLSTFVGMF